MPLRGGSCGLPRSILTLMMLTMPVNNSTSKRGYGNNNSGSNNNGNSNRSEIMSILALVRRVMAIYKNTSSNSSDEHSENHLRCSTRIIVITFGIDIFIRLVVVMSVLLCQLLLLFLPLLLFLLNPSPGHTPTTESLSGKPQKNLTPSVRGERP